MKKLIFPAIFGLMILGSCAQKEEKREEYKEDHYKNEMVNELGDSAVAASDKIDSAAVKIDSAK